MLQNIVFDMGNVLLDYNPQVPLNLFCGSREEKEIIWRELFQGPEWIQGDLGYITDGERYESVKRRVPEEMHPALKRCACEWDICMQPLPGAREFCDYLRGKGFRLYVLSNASESFYHYFPRFAPLDYFDGIVVSADIHIIKPDLRIYQYLLEQYGLIAGECLFIDDREANVEAARRAGMQGEIFAGDFEAVRRRHGL